MTTHAACPHCGTVALPSHAGFHKFPTWAWPLTWPWRGAAGAAGPRMTLEIVRNCWAMTSVVPPPDHSLPDAACLVPTGAPASLARVAAASSVSVRLYMPGPTGASASLARVATSRSLCIMLATGAPAPLTRVASAWPLLARLCMLNPHWRFSLTPHQGCCL